jgi:hypothetical protein
MRKIRTVAKGMKNRKYSTRSYDQRRRPKKPPGFPRKINYHQKETVKMNARYGKVNIECAHCTTSIATKP